MLCLQKGKTGEPTVPWEDQKLHYKRKGWVVKKRAAKKERNTRKKRFSRKTIRKICGEEKILREKQTLLPGIL